MAYNKLNVLQANISAIELALQLQKESRSPNSEEVRKLLSYKGFGGIPFILYPLDNRSYWASHSSEKYFDDVHRLYSLISASDLDTATVWEALKGSVLNSFYTPRALSECIVSTISGHIPIVNDLLEPSSGMGSFIRECRLAYPNASIDAVELDPITSLLLSTVYDSDSNTSVHQGGFEIVYKNSRSVYDLVITNVPFGNYGVSDSEYSAEKGIKQQSTKLIHRYFIFKGLDQLRPGGVLSYIVPRGILDSSEQEYKSAIIKAAHLISYQRLPDGLFYEDGGTKVGTDLIILQKRLPSDTLLTPYDTDFISSTLDRETGRNSFYEKYKDGQFSDVTEEKKDQYGRPRINYSCSSGNPYLRLGSLVDSDFSHYFSKESYTLNLSSSHTAISADNYGLDLLDDATNLLPPELSQAIPRLYTTENIPLSDRIAYVRYFHPLSSYTAYLLEYDANDRMGFGYVSLGGDFELGYIPFDSLSTLEVQGLGIERDIFFSPRVLHSIEELQETLSYYAPTHTAEVEDTYSVLDISEEGLPLDAQIDPAVTKSLEEDKRNKIEDLLVSKEGYRQRSLFDDFDYTPSPPSPSPKSLPITYTGRHSEYLQNDMLVQEGQVYGQYKDGMVHPLTIAKTKEAQVSSYIKLRDTYLELWNEEQIHKIAQVSLRSDLNGYYDEYVSGYGHLSEISPRSPLRKDIYFDDIKNLEINRNGIIQKSDIFDHPISFSSSSVSINSVEDALYHSINTEGAINFELMLSMYSKDDYTEDDMIRELSDKIIYDIDLERYVLKEMYLRGDVISKKEKVEAWLTAHPGDEAALHTLAELEKSIPAPIKYADLDFNLGERWIPVSYYSDFYSHLYGTEVGIDYIQATDTFTVSVSGMNALTAQEYMIKRHPNDGRTIYPKDLAQMALQDTTRFLTKKVLVSAPNTATGFQSVEVPDVEATNLLESKISKIRTEFRSWMKTLPDQDVTYLENRYNRLFNCNVKPHYDGSHQSFPDLNFSGVGFDDLYASQKDAIWMLKLNGGGICDHTVGGGKTAIMCVAAYEMKRLGYVNKPMIIGLKANISEIAATYQRLYPHARILSPSRTETSKKNMTTFLSKLKNNDYDCVILSHNQFESIPQDPEILITLLSDELSSLEDAIAEKERETGKDASLKELVRAKKSLERRLTNLQESISARQYSNLVTFKQLGIDHLFVDESHYFKNLFYVTKHSNVSGLGQKEGSQRALNLFTAIRTIQHRNGGDLGASFFSGTTITNSLTELYLLFKYLRPNELERQHINSFDSWASVFAEKSVEYEVSSTGQINPKYRFRKFIKVPELVNFYTEITDVRTAERIGLSRPMIDFRFHDLDPTPDQERYSAGLMQFAKNGDASAIGLPPLTDGQQKAKMLLATSLASKMSLDMRLINPNYGDDVGNKASVCAEMIANIYYKFHEQKGTQFVFTDLSSYKPDVWNVCSEIKRKLVEDYDIPADEIAFIQTAKTESMKEKLIEKMNAGKIRVLFGGTQNLGTGVNAQERAVAVHHLDVPWTPSGFEQRNGRAVRKGNIVAAKYNGNRVEVHVYATKKTLDSYRFDLLKNKQVFIAQIKENSISERTISEKDTDDVLNYAEFASLLSGNTDLLEKARLDKKVAVLKTEKNNFNKSQRNLRSSINLLEVEISNKQGLISSIESDLEKISRLERTGENRIVPKIIVKNEVLNKDNADCLYDILSDIRTAANTHGEYVSIGSVCGFPLCVRTISGCGGSIFDQDNRFYLRGDSVYYSYNGGKITTKAETTFTGFVKALDQPGRLIEQERDRLTKDKSDLAVKKTLVMNAWDKEEELEHLINQSRLIDEKLKLSNKQESPLSESEHEGPNYKKGFGL